MTVFFSKRTYARKCSLSLPLIIASLLSLTTANAEASTTYTLTEIGFQGFNNQTTGINNRGQVVGIYSNSYSERSFIWSNGQAIDIGTLGGRTTRAMGINDRGQVVGYAETATGSIHAFLYSNGQMTDIASSLYQGSPSFAYSINNSGQIVGHSDQGTFVYDNGVTTFLGTLGYNGRGKDINDYGQIVGNYANGGNNSAFSFSLQTGELVHLGFLAGDGRSYAMAINNYNQITGLSQPTYNSDSRAFLYSNEQMTDLGTPNGVVARSVAAIDINDSGDMVGAYSNFGLRKAFIYSEGKMNDLSLLVAGNQNPYLLSEARGINNYGQIIANGTDGSGRTYLLTPTAVPLPSSIWLFCTAVIGLVINPRKKALRT